MSEDFFFSAVEDLQSPTNAALVNTNETLSANAILDFDTQPISNSIGDSLPCAHRTPPWGLLYGLSLDMPQTQLTLDEYVVGRNDGPPVNLVLPRPPDSEKSRLNMWLSYSRVQFRIRRKPSGLVQIEDCSSNGTFINGTRLTKGQPVALANNTEIALSLAKNRVMMFADLSILDDPSIPAALRSQYRFSKQLGQGACGEVQLAFVRKTGTPVAIKIVHRSRFFTEAPAADNKKIKDDDKHSSYAQALREAKLMRDLSHPCIIKIIDVFDEAPSNDMFLVLEYAQGGELFDKIVNNGKLSESFAKFIFYQVALAVQYLHSNGITHRDLKPENILLSSDEDFPVAKLADFGLSKIVDPGTVLRTYCGTPTYLAPEIIKTKGNAEYSKKVDLWSLGVILFAALAGYPPFYNERTDLTLEEQIMKGSYSFPVERWHDVLPEAINLIKALMTVDPVRRLSADQTVAHPWMASDQSMLDKVNDVVFNGRGIQYHWSTQHHPRNDIVPLAGPSRGRGLCRLQRPTTGRLSYARTNEPEKDALKKTNDEEPKRPNTADGVRPLRRKNRDSDERVELAPAMRLPVATRAPLNNGNARYGSPVPPAKRGVAGENSRKLQQDHLAAAKTPKVIRRK